MIALRREYVMPDEAEKRYVRKKAKSKPKGKRC